MKLDSCYNEGMGEVMGPFYFKGFSAFYHRENLYLILCCICSLPPVLRRQLNFEFFYFPK